MKFTVKLLPQEPFLRSRILAALRTGWACLMAGLLIHLGNMHVQWMTFPVFSYVITVTVVGESTFGKAVQDGAAVVVGTVQGIGMSMLILQLVAPEKVTLWIAILCIATSTFIISYPKNTHVISKRVALAQTGIVYCNAYIHKGALQQINFPLRLAATTIVGAACGVLALLLPLPRLAFSEVQAQAKLFARVNSERLKLMVNSFCVSDVSQARSLTLQAKCLGQVGSSAVQEIKSKEADIQWETGFVKHASTLNQLIKSLMTLKEHLVAMDSGLEYDIKSSRRLNLQGHTMLKECLVYVANCTSLALMHISIDYPAASMAPNFRHNLNVELRKAMLMFDKILTTLSHKEVDGTAVHVQEDRTTGTSKPKFQSHVGAFFFLFNIRKFGEETMTIVSSLETDFTNSITGQDLENQVDKSQSPSDVEQYKLSSSRCARCKRLHHLEEERGKSTMKSKRSLLNWKKLVIGHSPDFEQARTALKMALCMSMATFLGMWFDKRHGYWADITLGLGFANSQGGSFKVANLRAQGTVAGSIYGLIAALATQNIPSLRLPSLIPWVIFTSFLRRSKIYEYAGAISAFTGAIVILSIRHKETDEDFTIIRIVEAFLGMASYIFIELVVLPRRASTLARNELIVGLRSLKEFAIAVISPQCWELKCQACCSHAVKDLKCKERNIRNLIAHQKVLLQEAGQEPELWFTPFPTSAFSKLVAIQGKMIELLHFALCSLESITCGSSNQVPSIQSLYSSHEPTFSLLKERISIKLEFLEKALRIESFDTKQEASQFEDRDDNNDVSDQNFTHKRSPEFLKESRIGNIRALPQKLEELIDGFEKSLHECAVAELVSSKLSTEETSGTMDDPVILALHALAFAMRGLIAETSELERTVQEMLQVENPWSLVHFGDAAV